MRIRSLLSRPVLRIVSLLILVAAAVATVPSEVVQASSECTVYCPNDPQTFCSSSNNQCDLKYGFGVYPTDEISCDGNPPIACPPRPGGSVE